MTDDIFHAVIVIAVLCAAGAIACIFVVLRSLTERVERLEEAVQELNPGLHL